MSQTRRLAGFDQCENSLALAKCRHISCDDQSGGVISGKFPMTVLNTLRGENNSLRGEKNSLRPGKKFPARGIGVARSSSVCAAFSRAARKKFPASREFSPHSGE
jgi:hypothetical protein